MANNETDDLLPNSDIIRHQERNRPFTPAYGSEHSELIEQHIEKYIGPIEMVYHELVSDLVHLDVHWVKPGPERPFHTLITSGMSDLPMTPPEGAEDSKYAELLIVLPSNWQLNELDFRDEKNYWPVRLLKWMARFPHEYETWLWGGHSIPNGDPPTTFHDSINFTGAILALPLTTPEEFHSLNCSSEKVISFFAVIPLYSEEITLKLQKGMDHLFDLFDKHHINEIIDLNRTNVAKKRWKLF